jgi:hypothetical protein
MKEHHKIHLAPYMYERARYYYEVNMKACQNAMAQYGYSEPPDRDICAHPVQWEGKHWNWFTHG